jgi:hypothetical protein
MSAQQRRSSSVGRRGRRRPDRAPRTVLGHEGETLRVDTARRSWSVPSGRTGVRVSVRSAQIGAPATSLWAR